MTCHLVFRDEKGAVLVFPGPFPNISVIFFVPAEKGNSLSPVLNKGSWRRGLLHFFGAFSVCIHEKYKPSHSSTLIERFRIYIAGFIS